MDRRRAADERKERVRLPYPLRLFIDEGYSMPAVPPREETRTTKAVVRATCLLPPVSR